MRKVFIFLVLTFFSLTGCALFSESDRDADLDSLERRILSIEKRQDNLEERIGQDNDNETYVSTVEVETIETSSPVKVSVKNAEMTDKDIQRALKNAGYYEGPIDGKIGRKSRKAIRDFQTDNGLKVDGIAGARTMGALEPYVSQSRK